MKDKQFLMIPGPTPVPERALLAMAKHPMGHRSSEFSAIMKEVYQDLKWLFQTEEDVFVYTASGTGAMEAAIFNLVNPGDKVLSLVIGNFSERWAKIAAMKGADVEKINFEWGTAVDPAVLKQRLDQDTNKEIKFVTLIHNETSTGVTNDLQTLAAIIREHGAISIVDGVTSVGALPVKMDEWGVDILISGSQKGFMIPPGLAFLACSKKAWKAYENCKNPSFYFNFGANKKAVAENSTPYTPNVSLIVALRETLIMMKEEGLDNIYSRHAKLASMVRNGVKELGYKLYVEDDAVGSKVITAIWPPEGISVPDLRKTLNKDYNIVVANGQGKLENQVFRIGHLGFVSERDVIMALGALGAATKKLNGNLTKV